MELLSVFAPLVLSGTLATLILAVAAYAPLRAREHPEGRQWASYPTVPPQRMAGRTALSDVLPPPPPPFALADLRPRPVHPAA